MSTKIYYGYRMNSLSIIELNKFYIELRTRYNAYCQEYFKKLLGSKIDEIADHLYNRQYQTLIAMKNYGIHSKEYKKELVYNNNSLLSLYNGSDSIPKRIKEISGEHSIDPKSIKKYASISKVIDHFSWDHNGSMKRLAGNIISNNNQMISITNECNCDYDFNGTIGIYAKEGISNDKVLLVIFGDVLRGYIQLLFESKKKEDKQFISKYGLEYYGYWNNTDKPDDKTDEEWDIVEKDWDTAIPKGTYAENGFSFEMFDSYMGIENFIWKTKNEDIVPYLCPLNKRLQKLSRNKVADNFITNYMEENMEEDEKFSISIYHDGVREFKKWRDENPIEYKKEVAKVRKIYKTLDIKSKEELVGLNILSLFPFSTLAKRTLKNKSK